MTPEGDEPVYNFVKEFEIRRDVFNLMAKTLETRTFDDNTRLLLESIVGNKKQQREAKKKIGADLPFQEMLREIIIRYKHENTNHILSVILAGGEIPEQDKEHARWLIDEFKAQAAIAEHQRKINTF